MILTNFEIRLIVAFENPFRKLMQWKQIIRNGIRIQSPQQCTKMVQSTLLIAWKAIVNRMDICITKLSKWQTAAFKWFYSHLENITNVRFFYIFLNKNINGWQCMRNGRSFVECVFALYNSAVRWLHAVCLIVHMCDCKPHWFISICFVWDVHKKLLILQKFNCTIKLKLMIQDLNFKLIRATLIW